MLALCLMLFHYDKGRPSEGWPWGGLPKRPEEAAEVVLGVAPVIVSTYFALWVEGKMMLI